MVIAYHQRKSVNVILDIVSIKHKLDADEVLHEECGEWEKERKTISLEKIANGGENVGYGIRDQ